MVYQKKGGAKAKQAPKKNKIELNDDFKMDVEGAGSDDYESDSDQAVKKTPKTPAAKTPKGKQPQSDKKVSFQIPGKNTPAKTPKNENSLVGKKLTPTKMSLKEFQGIQTKAQKNRDQKKQSVNQEEEEEDDDDDDEENIDDLDMLVGGDDDDDDEEEDEDGDDASNRKLPAKQVTDVKISPLGKSRTPVKNADKASNKKADKTPSKNSESLKITTSPKKAPVKRKNLEELKKAMELESERRRERDRKTLYIGNLPQDITATELKALSTDIVNVNIPHSFNKRKIMFAFLEFNDEEKAEENYNSFQKKKLRNVPVSVDYAGEKSRNKKDNKDAPKKQINLKKLYVPTLPIDVAIAQVAGFFPKAFQITLTDCSLHRSASINYLTEESAAADLEACKSAVFDGKSLTVLYSVLREEKSRKMGRRNKSESNRNAKRMKLEEKK